MLTREQLQRAAADSGFPVESAVLPLADHELAFLDRLNGHGEIEASLLTADADLQQRIAVNPGLRWKALNVKKHAGGDRTGIAQGTAARLSFCAQP